MAPWYEERPRQLDGLRVLAIGGPLATSRAWALWLLTEMPGEAPGAEDQPPVPAWVDNYAPFLGRLWGRGLSVVPQPRVNGAVFDWARTDPEGLRAAARYLAAHKEPGDDPGASRLWSLLRRFPMGSALDYSRPVFRARPEALVEAVSILIDHPDAVRAVATRPGYTDPDAIGGPLDRDLPREKAP
jgi:hypothetical protein